MKPNRNRTRDLGFYLIMLAILVSVIMLLTREKSPAEIENYSGCVPGNDKHVLINDEIGAVFYCARRAEIRCLHPIFQ